MDLSEKELECIMFFPSRYRTLSMSLLHYFNTLLVRFSGISEIDFDSEKDINTFSHDVRKNETIKNIGKSFLVKDSERFMKFRITFIENIAYEIYVNKDNCGENRLCLYNGKKMMISDEQTEKLLNPEYYKEIKYSLSTFLNIYRRFEIFWNSVNCFLSSPLEKYGYFGYFLKDSKADTYYARNRGGLLYSYGKTAPKNPVDFPTHSEECKKKTVLIPFENFVPTLKKIIEDMKNG